MRAEAATRLTKRDAKGVTTVYTLGGIPAGHLNGTKSTVWRTRSGKHAGGTFAHWRRLPESGEFVTSLARNLNAARNGIWKSRRGRHLGGVFARWRRLPEFIASLAANLKVPGSHLFAATSTGGT